jgi:hypothetical protein
MAEVPREIMNHLRAQMYNDRHEDRPAVPAQRTGEEDPAPKEPELDEPQPEGRIRKAISRLALGSTEPEPLGD